MPHLKWRSLSATILVLGFALFMAPAGCIDRRTPSEGGKPAAPSTDKSPGQKTLFWVDGRPVSLDEMDRFVKENLVSEPRHGHRSAEQSGGFMPYLEAYLRYTAILREGERLSVGTDPIVVSTEKLARLALTGRSYSDHIRKTAPVDPEGISALIPEKWVRMNFLLKMFPDMNRASEAMAAITGGIPFGEVKGELAIGARGTVDKQTGLIFPGSGFFDPVDEDRLFSLKQGEIAGPFRSGIGAALVQVVERRDMSQEEQSVFLGEARDRLAQKYLADFMAREIKTASVRILGDQLQQAALEDLSGRVTERPVLEVGGDTFPYRSIRYLMTLPLSYLVRDFGRANLAKAIEPDVKALAENVVLGLVAEREKYSPADPAQVEGPLGSVSRKVRYDQSLLLLTASMKPEKPTEGEVEELYRQRADEFVRPRRGWFSYYFTPELPVLESLLNQYRAGVPFERLVVPKKYLETQTSYKKPGLRMKAATYYDGDGRYMDIRADLEKAKVGEPVLVKGGMGHYLIMVDRREAGGRMGLADVRDLVEEEILETRRRAMASGLIDGILRKMNVEFSQSPPAEPQPDVKRPETG